MPSLNYTKFVDKVESGEKRCTIRAKRKRPIKIGDTLFHYTGMRTSACRKLRKNQLDKCIKTTPVVISDRRVLLGDEDLSPEEIVTLARADGFETGSEMLDYFNSRRTGVDPFEGDWIQW